jgi:chorismate mutase
VSEKSEFYIVRKRAVPEVLRGVVKVNQLLASGKARTVNEAVELAGISRSSYYKFKDDIEEFHDSMAGMNVTLSCEINDETGILASLLGIISGCNANILTIHQSIPISGVADLSISLQIRENTEDIGGMIRKIEALGGVRKIRIMGRDNIH